VAQRLALAAVLATGAGGCGDTAPSTDAQPAIDAFAFVRDEGNILSPGQERRAERELRDIATRTGVFGVLVTRADDEETDPPQIYRPIVAEVEALGGEGLINICTPEACGPDAGSAHTDGLTEAVEAVRAERPAVAPGQRRNVNQGIREWLDVVAAVAAANR
jgi:hypothetical protein